MDKDSIVESVRQDLLDRSKLGIKKYNTTLDREDLNVGDWITHAYQELLDGALYLKRLHKELGKTQTYVLADDFLKLEKELDIKNRIIENLSKVIKSQEEEIHQLKKQDYTQSKRRAWHY